MRRAAILAGVALLAGCTDDRAIDEAQELVKRELLDPDSAQFRDVEHHAENGAVCGQVNAKNAYGGYVGFVDFFVVNGDARLAPVAQTVFIDDVDRMQAGLADARFDMDRIDACQSAPLRARLSGAKS